MSEATENAIMFMKAHSGGCFLGTKTTHIYEIFCFTEMIEEIERELLRR